MTGTTIGKNAVRGFLGQQARTTGGQFSTPTTSSKIGSAVGDAVSSIKSTAADTVQAGKNFMAGTTKGYTGSPTNVARNTGGQFTSPGGATKAGEIVGKTAASPAARATAAGGAALGLGAAVSGSSNPPTSSGDESAGLDTSRTPSQILGNSSRAGREGDLDKLPAKSSDSGTGTSTTPKPSTTSSAAAAPAPKPAEAPSPYPKVGDMPMYGAGGVKTQVSRHDVYESKSGKSLEKFLKEDFNGKKS